jgi:hypothetical protein
METSGAGLWFWEVPRRVPAGVSRRVQNVLERTEAAQRRSAALLRACGLEDQAREIERSAEWARFDLDEPLVAQELYVAAAGLRYIQRLAVDAAGRQDGPPGRSRFYALPVPLRSLGPGPAHHPALRQSGRPGPGFRGRTSGLFVRAYEQPLKALAAYIFGLRLRSKLLDGRNLRLYNLNTVLQSAGLFYHAIRWPILHLRTRRCGLHNNKQLPLGSCTMRMLQCGYDRT